MCIERLKKIALSLPELPGVYKFFDKGQKIIYIGKAKNLKNRVASYFNALASSNEKTRRLVKEIRSVEYVIVNAEFDALLLENTLIKKNQPKYNILLRSGSAYPYICITDQPFPRIFCSRTYVPNQGQYFGPYTNARVVNAILDLIRKLYTIRSCNYQLSQANIEKKKFKICLEYHIKNCQGPCQGWQTAADYDADVAQIKRILKGNITAVKNYYKEKMQTAAQKLAFEQAALMKKRYEALEQFQQNR